MTGFIILIIYWPIARNRSTTGVSRQNKRRTIFVMLSKAGPSKQPDNSNIENHPILYGMVFVYILYIPIGMKRRKTIPFLTGSFFVYIAAKPAVCPHSGLSP